MFTTEYQDRSTITIIVMHIMKVMKKRAILAVMYPRIMRKKEIDNGGRADASIVNCLALSLNLKCKPLCNLKTFRRRLKEINIID